MGAKLLKGNERHQGFKPGQSGNPGGKPKIVKTLNEAGFDRNDLRVEVIQRYVETFRTLDPGNKDHSASWRAAGDKLWILAGLPSAPVVEVPPEMTDEEYAAECEEIAREQLRAMPLEERLRLIADPAPSDTIQ